MLPHGLFKAGNEKLRAQFISIIDCHSAQGKVLIDGKKEAPSEFFLGNNTTIVCGNIAAAAGLRAPRHPVLGEGQRQQHRLR